MQINRYLFTAILLAAALQVALAQGWERTFGTPLNDGLSDVLTTPDGGYLVVGTTQTVPSERQVLLLKTDADGLEQWSQHISHPGHELFGRSIEPTGDGGYIIGGTAVSGGISQGFLIKTDGLGQVAWTLFSVDEVQGRRAIPLSDGNFALVGSRSRIISGAANPDLDVFLMKTAGDTIAWWQVYGGDYFEEGHGLAEIPGAGLLVAGVTADTSGNGDYDVLLLRTDLDGNLVWENKLGTPGAEAAFGLAPCAVGNFVVVGQSDDGGASALDVLWAKISPDGNVLAWQTYPHPDLATAQAVQELADGSFILTGNVRADGSATRQVLLLKLNPDGSEAWTQTFGGMLSDAGLSVKSAPNDGFIVAGTTHSYGAGGQDGYLIRTDASGVSLSCLIRGNVRTNLNPDCFPEIIGQQVPGYLVEIAGATTRYATTDALGNYAAHVPEGSYNLRLLGLSNTWEPCLDSVDVTLTGTFDTVTVDFSLHALTDCPVMVVDLATLGLRRCFGNKYTVFYKNIGTQTAAQAQVEVTFDPFLTVDSASLAWASNIGNTFVFEIGDVEPFGTGSFEVFVTVDCDSTVLGQTHCSTAHIFPDSLCFDPNPLWDGASIQLGAACTGDSVVFTLTNVGTGNMAAPLDLIVIEDVIMGFQGSFILPSGGDTSFTFVANGATYRMEAEQSPGHPGNSKPSIAVEGCGASPFSIGYVLQFPTNDADLSTDTDCRENTGAFDPNDKQGFPRGYGLEHFILPNTDIEYLVRFQNTGTDTAFTVVIRDTLSSLLDPQGLQPGASSHPYRFEMYGEGLLKFIFENILLPDSNANEAASHGFVKFRIPQRAGNLPGQVIENSAAIYFDFNAPIITNTTFHTIGENFIVIDPLLHASTDASRQPEGTVYPNPFHESAVFDLGDTQGGPFTFHLFDSLGKEWSRAVFEGPVFRFYRQGLPAGIYFFRIGTSEGVVAAGKVVLK